MRTWILYSVLRVGIFVVILLVLLLLGIEWWIAATFAALLAVAVSLLTLNRLRDTASTQLADAQERRMRGRITDEHIEDEVIDEHLEAGADRGAGGADRAADGTSDAAAGPGTNPDPTKA